MIKLETISAELKAINKEVQVLSIKKLIDRIDAEVLKNQAIYKPSDKKQISAIEKYLKKIPKDRPILKTWSPLIEEKQVVFTNSYSLFILNRETLPFDVSFGNIPEEEQKQFTKDHEIEKSRIVPGCYPNIKNVIPNEMDQIDTFRLDVDAFLAWYKVQDKKEIKNNNILYNLGDDLLEYTINPDLMKEAIDILQLSGSISIEFYGQYKPCMIRTYGGKNIGLILPVRKY